MSHMEVGHLESVVSHLTKYLVSHLKFNHVKKTQTKVDPIKLIFNRTETKNFKFHYIFID